MDRDENRKYIIGWLTVRPGRGDDYIKIAREYAAGVRQEDGCIFFEINQSIDNPDVFIIAECFRDAAAHEAHLTRPLFIEAWKDLNGIAVDGKFENILAQSVVAQSVAFDPDSHTEDRL